MPLFVLGLFFGRYDGVVLVDFLFYSFFLVALLVFLGLGMCLLCCPQNLRLYLLPLSPLVGYSYVTLIGWYSFIFDLGGTDSYAIYAVFPPLVLLYFGIRKFRGQEVSFPDFGEWSFIITVGILAFLVLSIPLIGSGLTTIALTNNDIADSAIKATILKEFSTSEFPGFLGQQDTLRYHLTLSYFGPNLVTAFLSSLMSLETYKLESLSAHVFFLISVFLFYAIARESFRYNHFAATGLTALYGFNPLMWYIIYQGYLAQIIATTFSLGFFLVHFKVIESCENRRDYFRYFPIVILFNWGIFISYPQVFPLVNLVVIIYLVFSCFQKRSATGMVSWTNFFIKTFCLSIILSPHRVAGIILSVLVVTTVDFGWFFPIIPPATFLGILNMVHQEGVIWFHDLSGHLGSDYFFGSVLLLVLVYFGLKQIYKTDKKTFNLSGALILFIVSAYILLVFKDSSGTSLGGYRSFKLLTFFLPIILLCCLIIFRQMEWGNFPLVGAGAVLILCNVYSSYHLMEHMTKHSRSVSADLASLQKVSDNPSVRSINIRGSDWWEILWQTNFLLRKRLFFETSTYQGRERSALLGEWDLLNRHSEIVHLRGFEKVEHLDINPTYYLKKTWAPDKFGVKFGKGWQVIGKNRLRMHSNQAKVFIHSPEEFQVIDLKANFESTIPNQRLFINLQDKHLRECSSVCQAKKIPLTDGKNVIKFQIQESHENLVSDELKSSGWILTSLNIDRLETRHD
ncbi:MAG: hypothetical protein VYC17_00715 [Nitrospinota bacterium]|nr:hypothetical protein [Nitrospinota bacterium]